MIMKRKLVKQGLRALTITLPASWVESHQLKPGNEIDLIESDESLIISSEGKHVIKDITVDVSGLLPRMADRFMARAYQKGYDKIMVKFDDPDLMLSIKNKIPELMGFELLNIGKDWLEVQVISKELDLDFDTMLRRAFLILLDMGTTCHDAWKNGDKKALENIFHQDFDVNKFTYFCLRSLNKSSKMMNFGSSILYYLIESLEDLGDEFKAIGAILAKSKPDKDVLDIIAKLNEEFRISYEFFYEPKKEKAVRAFKMNQEVTSLIDCIIDKKEKEMIKVLIGLDLSNRIIYHLTTMRLDTLKELSGTQ